MNENNAISVENPPNISSEYMDDLDDLLQEFPRLIQTVSNEGNPPYVVDSTQCANVNS
jgi:hypothetical protein